MKDGLNILKDGGKKWFKGNKLHRTDGPAVEWEDGSKEWWQNGKLHRTDGPAIDLANGDKAWWQVELANDYKSWCQNDQLHRTDGPAVEYTDGTKEWYIRGEQYTEEEFKKYLLITKLAGI